MLSTVYTGINASSRLSSRPSLPRTVKIVGRPAKGLPTGVAFGGGPHQRCLVLRWLFSVHVGVAGNQQLDAIRAAASRAAHDRSHAGGDRCIRVCSGFQQQIDERSVRIGAGLR